MIITKTQNVFVAGGMPSVTYVDRVALDLERKLRTEIRDGYKVICVTGPTKSGKTVLTRHVLGRERSALVNGGQVGSGEEFWNLLLQDLSLPESMTSSGAEEKSVSLRYLISAQAKSSEGTTQTFNNNNKRTILRYLRENGLALIVDDFHYMPAEVQRDIVRSLKSEIFDGLVAILIAVPHRAFDAIGVEREMESRFVHVEIPAWETDELVRIPEKGFEALNMGVSDVCINVFSDEANGSPLLMQRFCGRLCNHYDIEQTLIERRDFKPSYAVVNEIFAEVAQQFGFPTFDRLARGPQSRSRRIDRRVQGDGESLDIYRAVLRAVSNTGPKEKIHYNEIRSNIQSPKNMRTSALLKLVPALALLTGCSAPAQSQEVADWSAAGDQGRLVCLRGEGSNSYGNIFMLADGEVVTVHKGEEFGPDAVRLVEPRQLPTALQNQIDARASFILKQSERSIADRYFARIPGGMQVLVNQPSGVVVFEVDCE
jgi:hypothetical protein